MTVNTLERHFRLKIGISPYSYIQNCRFSNVIAILETGGTVTDAAMESGFSDYSHFIASFKKRYGKTPFSSQVIQTALHRNLLCSFGTLSADKNHRQA